MSCPVMADLSANYFLMTTPPFMGGLRAAMLPQQAFPPSHLGPFVPHIPLPVHPSHRFVNRKYNHSPPHSSVPFKHRNQLNSVSKSHSVNPCLQLGNNNEAQQFLSRGGQVIVRMRGLPYDCTAQQVMDFFAGKQPCDILHGEDGVLFVRKADGRATGDAFVLFDTEEMASKALLKHREVIGARYIELFRSSTAEVQQVLNRTMELVRPFEQPASYPMMSNSMNSSNLAPLGIHPHMLSQARKDCIRLRGLPYEALVEQILEFLGDNSKNIVYQGVHMVYNAQGQPSGEAFIQMNSEGAAAMAANQCHHKYMACMNAQTQVKKQRYIEVFQCSIDDMNMVLTGGAVPAPTMPRQLLSPGGSLLPAYGGGFPYLQSPPTVLPSQAAQAAAASGGLGALSPPGGRVSAGSYGPPHHQAPPPHYPPQSVLYWPYPSPPVSPFFNCYKVADCI